MEIGQREEIFLKLLKYPAMLPPRRLYQFYTTNNNLLKGLLPKTLLKQRVNYLTSIIWWVEMYLLHYFHKQCISANQRDIQMCKTWTIKQTSFRVRKKAKIQNSYLLFALSDTPLNGISFLYNVLHKCTLNWAAWQLE